MKKLLGVVTAVATLLVVGCASAPASSETTASPAPAQKKGGLGGVPDFVNDAFLNASEDVLVGIGTYKTGGDTSKISHGKTMAETRARADIARQLNSIIKNMVTDYTATSELDPEAAVSFQESITQALTQAELRGSKTVQMQTDDNGVLWLVMEYSKSEAAKDFDAAQSAARLAVPAATAFNALDRMDTAFNKQSGGGPVPVGD